MGLFSVPFIKDRGVCCVVPWIYCLASVCALTHIMLDGVWERGILFCIYCQLRARMALSIFKYTVPLRTRRALLLYNGKGNSALLVLNGTSVNSDSALLALNWQILCFCTFCWAILSAANIKVKLWASLLRHSWRKDSYVAYSIIPFFALGPLPYEGYLSIKNTALFMYSLIIIFHLHVWTYD